MFDLTKPLPMGLSRRNWPYCLFGFAIAVLVVSQLDVWASRGAINWPDAWRAPFLFITDYGLSDWILIPTLVAFLVARLASFLLKGLARLASFEVAMFSLAIFLGVGVPGLMCNILKRIVGRGRPVLFDQSGAFSFQPIVNDWSHQSFPSGHTTTAIALAFTIGFLVPRLFPWLLALGVIVGISRVPVGMHYPTDVFAGACLGMLGAYLVRNMLAARRWLFVVRPDGHIVPRAPSALPRLFSGRRRNAAAPRLDRP